MAGRDFYDELDLRYPEIAICLEKIDRTNPGVKNFYIPILTPNVDITSLKTKTEIVHQNSANIANENKVKISNIQIQNYIPITIPKELCSFVGGNIKIENGSGSFYSASGDIVIDGNTTSDGGDYSHTHRTLAGLGRSYFNNLSYDKFSSECSYLPVDEERYIPEGSKWIVVFIGGDIGKPQIIGRYTDPL